MIFALAIVVFPLIGAGEQQGAKSAEEILQSYVADFRHDPAAAEPITFAVRVTDDGGGDWHVVATGKKQAGDEYEVTLKPGLPSVPVAIYALDLATLRKIDRGEMNALTAMARARPGDPVPMEMEVMPGFQPEPAFLGRFIPFTFHFWTRGLPERVPFRRELSRVAHGANVVVFYYEKGLRSAWMQLDKGQHANKETKDQVNPFPTLVIMLRGKTEARIGGKQLTVGAGEMMLVPRDVSHEFWNPYDQPAEMVLVMFGEGA